MAASDRSVAAEAAARASCRGLVRAVKLLGVVSEWCELLTRDALAVRAITDSVPGRRRSAFVCGEDGALPKIRPGHPAAHFLEGVPARVPRDIRAFILRRYGEGALRWCKAHFWDHKLEKRVKTNNMLYPCRDVMEQCHNDVPFAPPLPFSGGAPAAAASS